MKKVIWIIILIVVVFAGYRYYRLQVVRTAARESSIIQEKAVPVEIIMPKRGMMTETISVTGTIRPKKEVNVASKVAGRVEFVKVDEGDRVRAGQVLVQLDRTEFVAQVNQSKAALQLAQARLAQAKTGANLQTTQTSTNIQQAEAALVAAKARLAVIKTGAREQERKQAENAVDSAKANFDNVTTNYQRMQTLFNQGAISKQQLDIAKMQYDVAKSQYDSARQALELVQIGARPEDIQAAEQQVRQAEAALELARASKAQNVISKEDIEAAKAGVAQAQAALEYAQLRLQNTTIKAPISGVVTYRGVNLGEMVSSGEMGGRPLLMIVDNSVVYVETNVNEEQIKQIKLGQLTKVTVDAIAGRVFWGRIKDIVPSADPRSRAFKVNVSVPNPGGELQQGMFARVDAVTVQHPNALLVPREAVQTVGGRQVVFVVESLVAKAKEVITSLHDEKMVEIISGLTDRDKVIIKGQAGLRDGDKVAIQSGGGMK